MYLPVIVVVMFMFVLAMLWKENVYDKARSSDERFWIDTLLLIWAIPVAVFVLVVVLAVAAEVSKT